MESQLVSSSSLSEVIRPPPVGFAAVSCVSSKSRRRKSKQQQQRLSRRRQDGGISALSYPKSFPTPLLVGHGPQAQTREELLEKVLGELEAAAERGVRVETGELSSLLEICFRLGSLQHGMRVRRLIPPVLLRKTASLSSRLLRLYASCGLVGEAHHLFDEMSQRCRLKSAFAWNSLISGYAGIGQYEDAMALYHQMVEEGVEPDRFTFPRVLKVCGGLGSIAIGEAVHRDAVRCGFGDDPFVLNALVDMYAKCGDILEACRIFGKIACRDAISWNSMLTGYARHGLFAEALQLCGDMLRAGVGLDSVAVSTLLAGVLSSKLGAQFHGWALRRDLGGSLSVGNALISMYSACKRPEDSRKVFESMPERDVVTWNAMICAYSRDERALSIFRRMEASGVPPDAITFVALLSACANMGLVEEGRELFGAMGNRYKMKPGVEHYGCMVNLLGRAGLVEEAYQTATAMDFDAGPTVWGALLFACSLHGNVAVGEAAAERLFELEPDNEHNFDLLMRIYDAAGRWKDVERVRGMMRDRGLESSYSTEVLN